jgi:hypothetical protein
MPSKAKTEIRGLPKILNIDRALDLTREVLKTEEDLNEEQLVKLNQEIENIIFVF